MIELFGIAVLSAADVALLRRTNTELQSLVDVSGDSINTALLKALSDMDWAIRGALGE